MAHIDSDDTQENSQYTVEETNSPSKIPGGEKKQLPEEPQPTEEEKSSNMGCGPLHKIPDDDDNSTKQTKITDHFPKKRSDDTQANNSVRKKAKGNQNTNNQATANLYADDFSDEDRENNDKKRNASPRTRSSMAFSKLSIKFENSDDEESSSYASWSQRDISEYRNNYPDTRQYSTIKENYNFYTNKIPSHPDGDYIDNIHKKWFGDYRKLEFHHGYIQWLFPLQEKGLNFSAEPLQKHEIESIKKDPEALKRILKSYKMMLDFYGFELVDDKTGEIRRNKNNYSDRFRNLNTSSHNYLRITRILKCLGEFDYEYLKFPFLERLLQESITNNKLPNCLRSCKDYWIETLRSRAERRAIRTYAMELVEYRNKGIEPPKSHCAKRPSQRQESATNKQQNQKPIARTKSFDE